MNIISIILNIYFLTRVKAYIVIKISRYNYFIIIFSSIIQFILCIFIKLIMTPY